MPSVTPATARRLREFLEAVSCRELTTFEQAMAQEARELLHRLGARKAPQKALPFPIRKAAKRVKREEHAENTRGLRLAAMGRAGECCEACGFPATEFDTLDMDHLESGSGVRRQKQALSNVWMIHRSCHRARTASPKAYAWKVRLFCKRNGYPIPRRFL